MEIQLIQAADCLIATSWSEFLEENALAPLSVWVLEFWVGEELRLFGPFMTFS